MTADNIFKIIVGTVTLAVLGFIIYSASSAPGSSTVPALLNIKETDWFKGQTDASATLIEYSDFQCPACAAYYPLVKKMAGEFPADLKVVYRHFPLTQIHKNAMAAAQAAEAAGSQGKFWEMHDKLFEGQTVWANESNPLEFFKGYAKELTLDEAKFLVDYGHLATADKVKDQLTIGNALGVNATPTFYLNGKKLSGINSEDQFRQLIQGAIDEAKKTFTN